MLYTNEESLQGNNSTRQTALSHDTGRIEVISRSTLLGKEIDVYGSAENPLFKAKDVAEWIDYANISDLLKMVDDEEKGVRNSLTPGGNQQVWFITEDGLYEVLMQSRKPIAKQFKRGVKEILKSLRRTGSYSANKAEEPAQIPLRDKITWVKEVKKLLNLNDASTLGMLQQVGVPLGLPMPEYVPSKGVLHSATELLKKHGLTISAKIFNQKAIEAGFLARMFRKSSKGDKPFNVITEKGKEYGENQVNPKNPRSTQPLWYDDKFAQMLEEIGI